MKIKTKKQLNLPQLIEWGKLNFLQARNEKYESNSMTVSFSESGNPHVESRFHYLQLDEVFEVIEEVEITEDTVIPKMLEMYRDATSNLGAEIYINQSINSVIENADVLTLHIVNDDGTHTLIWRDGKLVE